MKKILSILTVSLLLFSRCGSDAADDVIDEFSASASISATSSSVNENVGTFSVSISLSEVNTSGASLTIPFSLSGTATENSDYSIDETSVIIGTNEQSATLNITITDDSDVESAETIIVTLGTLPSTLSAGSSTAVTITINDNDDQNGGSNLSINFGSASGSTITIEDWTDMGADSYLVLINTENSFSDITSSSNMLASTTYRGYGEQVVYNGSNISEVSVSLLQFSTPYYFKIVPVSGGSYDNSQAAASSTTDVCVTTSTTESQVCFEISSDLRTISSNQHPNHTTGEFPNYEGPAGEEFLPTEVSRALDLTPTYTGSAIYVYDETGPPTPSNDNFWQFGIATNGVEFHPMGLKPWENPDTGEENWEWQAKVTVQNETHLDAYGAHVTSKGVYHYHGDIVGLAADEDGSKHSLIYGFAADGFPIYYKYGYSDPNDPTSSIVELESSYQLKSGTRTGTGVAGQDYPDGTYDGTYIQDYEYAAELGDLDECNGRTGVTPEYPDGTYYYVITSGFPVTPNCFFGTPAEDWEIGS
ncbi:YHYH protein [Ekhidna sp.]|uniref:YHYH protein n=1 Tax=Ekhidna sp. TaxID=2608089 RepID=UPI003517B8E6